MKKRNLLAAAAALMLGGCTPPPMSEMRAKLEDWMSRLGAGDAQALLASGLKLYEAGDYAEAAASLHAALAQGLPARSRAAAHKHLAFIYCAARLEPACAAEFRKALVADPAMDLDAAEAGHPTWGPAFRQAKAER